MKWPACGLHREHWTKLGTEASFPCPFWKTFASKHFAFLGSGSLLSLTECWALWSPAQYKCLRSHYSNMSVPLEWASLPRGSPQCIPIGRIALSRLCHQRKYSDSKRLDAQTKMNRSWQTSKMYFWEWRGWAENEWILMREGKEIHHELQTSIVLKGHCSPWPQNKHERNTFHEVLLGLAWLWLLGLG